MLSRKYTSMYFSCVKQEKYQKKLTSVRLTESAKSKCSVIASCAMPNMPISFWAEQRLFDFVCVKNFVFEDNPVDILLRKSLGTTANEKQYRICYGEFTPVV